MKNKINDWNDFNTIVYPKIFIKELNYKINELEARNTELHLMNKYIPIYQDIPKYEYEILSLMSNCLRETKKQLEQNAKLIRERNMNEMVVTCELEDCKHNVCNKCTSLILNIKKIYTEDNFCCDCMTYEQS